MSYVNDLNILTEEGSFFISILFNYTFFTFS